MWQFGQFSKIKSQILYEHYRDCRSTYFNFNTFEYSKSVDYIIIATYVTFTVVFMDLQISKLMLNFAVGSFPKSGHILCTWLRI